MGIHDYDNSNYKKYLRDEAIENATSFKEARAIIVSRLNNLCIDLSAYSTSEDALTNEILKAQEDKVNGLMDFYAGLFAPCKVTNPSKIPTGQADMNDILIDFSEGFNDFIESMEERYVELIMRRRKATILLSRMLSFKLPFSQLMYLFYYKRMHRDEITKMLFISRATFYRLKSQAIDALTRFYYPYNNTGGAAVNLPNS